MKDFQIIILAAGQGRRMKSGEMPKVLLPLSGKPLISRVLDTVMRSGLDPHPAIVIGKKGEKIKQALGGDFQYIYQYEAEGTGQAVLAAKKILQHSSRHVMVLPGDHPLLSVDFIYRLAHAHLEAGTAITLATAPFANFEKREMFAGYDRVARGSLGQVIRLLPPAVTRGSEEVWSEVSPGYFCFQASWLWPNLYRLNSVNPERETRLADLVNVAIAERKLVSELVVMPGEALGADTPEQLKFLENLDLGAKLG